MSEPQSYQNHRRIVPGYHFFLTGILVVNLLVRGWLLYRSPGLDTGMDLGLALAFLGLLLFSRLFALTAQDRVIRLEERLRLERLLPDDLRERMGELRRGHWVGLRFAADEEVPELVRAALDERLGCESIKKRIRKWRPDHLRV